MTKKTQEEKQQLRNVKDTKRTWHSAHLVVQKTITKIL